MSSVALVVVSPDVRSERRVEVHATVKQLKTKLESVTGISPDAQLIRLYNTEADAAADTSNGSGVVLDDDRMVGYYSVQAGQVLKVVDLNPSGTSLTGQFTDVSQVDKFEMTDDDYSQRRDTVLAYKKAHHLGRFAEPDASSPSPKSPTTAQVHVSVGSRCEVGSSEDGDLKKRGAVRYVGSTKFGKGDGVWIGVEYDEPLGKNDGSVQGERYFTCRPSYGAFVRPDKVTVGDFPVKDLDMDEDEEI